MIERILDAILESPIGIGVLSGVLGAWLINRLGNGKNQIPPGFDPSMLRINKETGRTEREEMLLQLERAQARVKVLEAQLNLERRLKEAEMQLIAIEAVYGLPHRDEGKVSPVVNQAMVTHRLKYGPDKLSIMEEKHESH